MEEHGREWTVSWWARLVMRVCGFKILPLAPGSVVVFKSQRRLSTIEQEKLGEFFYGLKCFVLVIDQGQDITTILTPEEARR